MAKNAARCRPLYEDQDARISILASDLASEDRIRFRRLLRTSDTNYLPTGRAIRLTRRLDAVRCAFRYVASIMTVFGAASAAARPFIMRRNTPISPHVSSDCRASCAGRSRWADHASAAHCGSRKRCRSTSCGHQLAACHGSWGRMAAGAPSARPSVSTGRSSQVSSRSLDQIAPVTSMGPDPSATTGATPDESGRKFVHAGEVHDTLAGKPDAQCKRAASGLHEAAQGGQVEVGLDSILSTAGCLTPGACAICSWLRSASRRSAFNPSTSTFISAARAWMRARRSVGIVAIRSPSCVPSSLLRPGQVVVEPTVRPGDKSLVEPFLRDAAIVAGNEQYGAALRVEGEGHPPSSVFGTEPQLLHVGMARACRRVGVRTPRARGRTRSTAARLLQSRPAPTAAEPRTQRRGHHQLNDPEYSAI